MARTYPANQGAGRQRQSGAWHPQCQRQQKSDQLNQVKGHQKVDGFQRANMGKGDRRLATQPREDRRVQAFPRSADGCTITPYVGRKSLLPHGHQKSKGILACGAFLICIDRCTIAYGIHNRSRTALFQELQRTLPTLAFRISSDSCTVAHHVVLNSLLPHVFQKIGRTLPSCAFLTRADCYVVSNSVHCQSSLALFQKLQCELSTTTFLASAAGCIVAHGFRLTPPLPHGLQKSKRARPFCTFLTCTDCCVVANSLHSPACLAIFQKRQR